MISHNGSKCSIRAEKLKHLSVLNNITNKPECMLIKNLRNSKYILIVSLSPYQNMLSSFFKLRKLRSDKAAITYLQNYVNTFTITVYSIHSKFHILYSKMVRQNVWIKLLWIIQALFCLAKNVNKEIGSKQCQRHCKFETELPLGYSLSMSLLFIHGKRSSKHFSC